jgi:chromate transporter
MHPENAENVTTAGGAISLTRFLAVLLKIGAIGFGGGMAVIALMEDEFVRRRRLVSADEFVHGVGLGQILGSFAVNTSIFLGYRLFGAMGAVLSAGVFLAPSIALVILLSDLYFRYHALPALQGTMAGLGPVAIALIVAAGWSIGRKVIRSWPEALVAIAALAAGVAGLNAVWILVAAGAVGFLTSRHGPVSEQPPPAARPGPGAGLALMGFLPLKTPMGAIVSTFLKTGLVFFGGGFALVPVLHHRLVSELGWLTLKEFLDGVAISNLTPGPIAVLATFAGYKVGGTVGALAATASLFAQATVLMLVISRQYLRLRDDDRARRFLAGVNPAVVGLILSAALELGMGALVSWRGCFLFSLSLLLLVRFRWYPAVVLAMGATAGYFGLLS